MPEDVKHSNDPCVLDVQKEMIDNQFGRRAVRYHCSAGSGGVAVGLFLVPGMGGSMSGSRAKVLRSFALTHGLPFLSFDYTYLGSSVVEEHCKPWNLISLWLDDAKHMPRLARGRRLVLVGFSIGVTVALQLALGHPERVCGLVLCSPVFNITQILPPRHRRCPLIWIISMFLRCKLSVQHMRKFLRDAAQYKFTLRPDAVPVTCPVRIVQGMQDIFPYTNAIVLGEALAASDVTVTLVKAANHYLLDHGSLDPVTRGVACILATL
ncbi:palmitoyl-protein thioesterase ABHD10, mitochondrial-like [Eriocheir sinensis]|uniref:palmitoyl-protein thioesterase ABHD10, mitochondrial-like n=1 Tax=Eriocheir sinensis TaxID=95602 RepID=UPI0021C7FD48|nr:palmitoyl-protein thioesterase ABHD10, mitochondrial-like [Eriocheir sinensis]